MFIRILSSTFVDMSNKLPLNWREKLHELSESDGIPVLDKKEKAAAYAAAYKIYQEPGNRKQFTVRNGFIFRKKDLSLLHGEKLLANT